MLRSPLTRLAPIAGAIAVVWPLTCSAQVPAQPPAEAGKDVTRQALLAQLYNRGMMFFEAGKYPETIEHLEKFLGMLTGEETQKTPLTYLTLGEASFRSGQEDSPKKAIGYWTEFLRRWPADPKGLEVKVAVAQANMQLKNWTEALSWWGQVEPAPSVRESSLSGQAACYRQLKQPEDEIKVLERLINPDFNTATSAEGAVRLMSLYALKYDPAVPESVKFADQAIVLLKRLQAKTHLVENIVALNGIAIKLGDELLEVNAHLKALDAYWTVRPREVVAKMQRDRIAAMELRVTQNLKAAGKDPMALSRAARLNSEVIAPRLEVARKVLAEFESLPDFLPALYFRMARCFAELDKKWEAVVLFNQILSRFPDSPMREAVLFSRLNLYSELGNANRTYRFCDDYLTEFPAGPHAAETVYIKGLTAMRKQDWFLAEKHLGEALKFLATLPKEQKNLYWTEARYQHANALFLQNKFPEAQADFESFLTEFGTAANGKGAFMEDVEYQLALTHLFSGHYEKDPANPGESSGAIERLQAFMAKWGPKSNYSSDAKYRLAVCRFAAGDNELCAAECLEWLETFGKKPGEGLHPEVYSLLGDARAALKDPQGSAAAYIGSYQRAKTEEVLNYALFEAGKQLQKAGDWEGVEKLYTGFVQARPGHQAVVTALYWVGKAKSKLGRMDEAKDLAVQTLGKYLGDPRSEGVEMILTQVADWSRRRPAGAEIPPAADGTPGKWDAQAELDRLLKPLRENANPTAEARLLYARAELEKLGRNSEKHDAVLAELAARVKAEDLSPYLLMELGDFLLARGGVDQAEPFFRALKENFAKAMNVDAAYVGLGEVALARKDFKKAMALFQHAIERLGAPYKQKEALLGQAKCYMEMATAASNPETKYTAMNSFEKARKLFEQVANVREWRGESTAFALYQIAEIQFRQNKWPEATSLFERVAVTQQRYPRWAVRAYAKASDGYLRMGKNQLARDRLKELLAVEKFQSLPEAAEAKKRLAELGGAP